MPSSGVQTCALDRKSTRLNSSHGSISYAVFCLKKKHLSRSSSPLSGRSTTCYSPVRPSLPPEPVSPCCWYVEVPPPSFILSLFFFLMIRRPPRSTLFPSRRSSDLAEPGRASALPLEWDFGRVEDLLEDGFRDRKSTRLNSSHGSISDAGSCFG